MIIDRKKVLTAGGSGLVGRHLKDILPHAVYISSKDYNLTRIDEVRDMMNEYEPDIVIHLAAIGAMKQVDYRFDGSSFADEAQDEAEDIRGGK